MTFSEKKIQLQFSLASGEFEGGGNSATVDGLRIDCQISASMAPSFATMELAVYGLPLSVMQQLTTVGTQWNARYKNGIDVLAGDDDSMSLVFSGTIFSAYVDATQMPNTCLRVVASPFVFESVAPADPTSIQGSADVAGMIQTLVGKLGGAKGFETNGVNVKLSNPYLYGSVWGQIREIAESAGIDVAVDRGVVVISPRGTPRQGEAPLISPGTGLVSYPTFVQNRVVLRTLFDPRINLLGPVNVQSSLQPACGQWQVIQLDYDLTSLTPGGNWFQTVNCVPVGTQ